MKIYYSPYFNGHTYLNYSEHKGGLMGEVIESSEGLLSRLELKCGTTYPDESDSFKEKRVDEYYNALKKSVQKGQPLYDSLSNDDPAAKRYNVTEELLRWRDVLILAGWNKETALTGKLSAISETEPNVPSDGYVTRGSADRWFRLLDLIPNLQEKIEIEVHCPEILIEPLIMKAINAVDPEHENSCKDLSAKSLKDCHVYEFNELYEAYEWLALQPVTPNQVIVCKDGQRLDNILNCFGKPFTSEDAKIGCHHVITDVRSFLDAPESLLWIDCNGDYGFHYPYDFLSVSEKQSLSFPIPEEQKMLEAVHNHFIHQLNQIQDLTLVCSKYDTATLLTQHPMVASALYKNGKEEKATPCTPNIQKKTVDKDIRFTPQSHYKIKKDADVMNLVMSYSSTDQLIQLPFNFVVERELGLYEPYDKQEIRTEKGNVAHRTVRFLFHEGNSTDLAITKPTFDRYFQEAYHLMDDHTTKYDSILLNPENKFELEDLEFNLWNSLQSLSKIITDNNLIIVGSEVEISQETTGIPVKLNVFGESKAFIDLILKKKDAEDYYIFDFKYSLSTRYSDKLEKNKSIQFAFYQEIFKYYQGGGKHLAGIGYYLFPKHTLYVPDNLHGGLHGKDVQMVYVNYTEVANTLNAMQKSVEYRRTQLADGIIEEGEELPIDSDYASDPDRFPLEEKYKKPGEKEGPYIANHIVLKNQIR